MPVTPRLEKPPDLTEPWSTLWRDTLKQLKQQRSWVSAQRPLLDEYIRALRMADVAFEAGESGDRHSKRALAYAIELGLTARARKALALKKEEAARGDDDPFKALDEVGERRKAKARRT